MASERTAAAGSPHSLYLHVPFCSHRCAYCDFNTYAGQERLIPSYVEALRAEIAHVGQAAPADLLLHTVFFGGGTPSLLSAPDIAVILEAIQRAFRLAPEAEITIEANPGTVDIEKLSQLLAVGVNRISLGVQSANGEELRHLERVHSYLDVLNAISGARQVGFRNLNVDLIYGLPEQKLETWQITVNRILDLDPEHISAYALSLEHGTPFGAWASRGLLKAPDPDLAADMYEWASEAFESAGYRQYEISNWAKPGYECRHNLQYWRGLPYLGMGAGAHGYAAGYRYSNVRRIETYVYRLRTPPDSNTSSPRQVEATALPSDLTDLPMPAYPMSPAMLDCHRQSRRDDIVDFMVMGLRLTREGVAASTFRQRFGSDLDDVFGSEIGQLHRLGLVELANAATQNWNEMGTAAGTPWEVLRLSSRGRLLGNQVFARFVD